METVIQMIAGKKSKCNAALSLSLYIDSILGYIYGLYDPESLFETLSYHTHAVQTSKTILLHDVTEKQSVIYAGWNLNGKHRSHFIDSNWFIVT